MTSYSLFPKSKDSDPSTIWQGMSVLLLVFSAIFLCGLVYITIRGIQSRNWPFVEGEMEVEFYGFPAFKLKYSVDNQGYTSNSVKFLQNQIFFVDKGTSKVKVYYNEKNPKEAVVYRGWTVSNYLMLLVGILFIPFAWYIRKNWA